MKDSQLYIYMKDKPQAPMDPSYYQNLSAKELLFWKEEERKVLEGIVIDGYPISGWLYWHINHWCINMDVRLPNGESVSEAKTPLLRDNELIINEALLKAEDYDNPDPLQRQLKGLIILGLRQMGKFLADYEPIIYDDRLGRIGDAKVGDKIFGKDGRLYNITGVFPQGKKDIYRMYLTDGRFIDSGDEHLWEVWYNKNHSKVLTTKQLRESKLSSDHKKSGKSYKYRLPEAEAVEFSKKDLPVNPYLLGILIGDGSISYSTPRVSVTDQEILDNIQQILGKDYSLNYEKYEFSKLKYKCRHSIIYKGKDKYSLKEYKQSAYGVNPLARKLKELGLNKNSYNKFIPEVYKFSSKEDRLELLQGLMDSDGSVNKNGNCEFKVVNKVLAEDVLWLARSLGIRGEINTKETKSKLPNGKTCISLVSRVYLRTDKPIFKLTRKLNKLKTRKNTSSVAIKNIEYLGNFNATCISIDSPDKLFLTKDFIVTHNTTFESSYSGRSGVIFKGSQNLILGTTLGDLNNITQNIDFGLLNCTPWFRTPRISRDWDSERVMLGFKTVKGDNQVWSQYVIRNTAGGKKTEAGAGTTIKSMVYDEIGKDDFIQAFIATKPAMIGRFGYRAVPILVGTGGSFEKGTDAKNLFFKPSAHNMVEFLQPDGRITGLFMPGTLRQDCKYTTTLGQWLLDTKRREYIPPDSELFNIPMETSDFSKAEAVILKGREAARLDPDPKAWLKEVMYFPLTIDEVFITDSNNPFPLQQIDKHITNLKENYSPQYVELQRSPDDSVTFKISEKRPISQFPIDRTTLTDTPCVMYEPPIKDLPYATYVCGIDPYNQDQASGPSPSLGSLYIMKRMYDPLGSFQNSIVFSYTGRPRTLKEFYDICDMAIDLYKAIALPENEGSMIQYFIQKGKDHVLFDSPALTKYINPMSSTAGRSKGLAATTPNQKHYMKLMLEYSIERMSGDPDTPIEDDQYGLIRIPDIMLLEEMKQYRGKSSGTQRGVHDGNYDRICAFGHVLTLANYLDRDFPLRRHTPKSDEVRPRDPKFTGPFPIVERKEGRTISPFNFSTSRKKLF